MSKKTSSFYDCSLEVHTYYMRYNVLNMHMYTHVHTCFRSGNATAIDPSSLEVWSVRAGSRRYVR